MSLAAYDTHLRLAAQARSLARRRQAIQIADGPGDIFEQATDLFQEAGSDAHGGSAFAAAGLGSVHEPAEQLTDLQDLQGQQLAMLLCAALSEPVARFEAAKHARSGLPHLAGGTEPLLRSDSEPWSQLTAPNSQAHSPSEGTSISAASGAGLLPQPWMAHLPSSFSSPVNPALGTAAAAAPAAGAEAGGGVARLLRVNSSSLPAAARPKRRAVRASRSASQLLPPLPLQQQQQHRQSQLLLPADVELSWPGAEVRHTARQQQQQHASSQNLSDLVLQELQLLLPLSQQGGTHRPQQLSGQSLEPQVQQHLLPAHHPSSMQNQIESLAVAARQPLPRQQHAVLPQAYADLHTSAPVLQQGWQEQTQAQQGWQLQHGPIRQEQQWAAAPTAQQQQHTGAPARRAAAVCCQPQPVNKVFRLCHYPRC